jgi:hypothetical protein
MAPGGCISLGRTAAVVVVGLFAGSCASYKSLEGRQVRPKFASVTLLPASPPTADRPAEVEETAVSASDLLERAFVAYQLGRDRRAADSFRAAINTGSLNDAGRALAYWHMALAERRLGNEDTSAEALWSFIFVAQDIIDVRDEHRYSVDGDGDFIDHFNLESRQAEAKGFLAAVWARRVEEFGHSMDVPVVVLSELEGQAFIDFAPICDGEPDRDVRRDVVYIIASIRVERVRINCMADYTNEPYYIVFVLPYGETP